MSAPLSVEPGAPLSGPLRVTRDGHIAVVTLDRPEALNAINAALALALGTALEELDADAQVRAIVITGAGRAFCAGMDLKAFADGASIDDASPKEWGFAGIASHWIATPVIAAVNGIAMGGGAEIALAADLVVMDEGATLGFPEVSVGLFAAGGAPFRLPQQVPQKVALEWLLTGRRVDAAEAERWGLANRVAPSGTALEVALELAGQVAAQAPQSVRVTKELTHRAAAASSWSPEVSRANRDAVDRVFASNDAGEGVAAFLEKRRPEWSGS